MLRIWLAGLFVLGMQGSVWGQLGQKPSGYEYAERRAFVAERPKAKAEPSVVTPAVQLPRSKAGPGWVNRLDNRAEFDRFARVYDAGTPLALPHLLFAIDRGRKDQIFYIDSRRFKLHEDFLKARDHVSDYGLVGLNENYRSPQRRYLFGTLTWRAESKSWAFEFWEGDKLTPELLLLAERRLAESFFAPVVFKPNSSAQEQVGQGVSLPMLTQLEIIARQGFLPLNSGKAVGKLRVLAPDEGLDALEPDDIVLLQEVPLALPPVAGVITTRPSTTLSHVNLLARGWRIPNAYVQDVSDWLPLAGQWVKLEVSRTGVSLTRAEPAAGAMVRQPGMAKAWPQPDLQRGELLAMRQMRATDRVRCGSKAANLGELAYAQRRGGLPGVAPVPDGFCIPFSDFAAFMAQPAAQAALQAAQADPGFASDRQQRAKALAALREALLALPIPQGLEERWQQAWARQLGGVGVFVRSSSNSEDLPGFSGAGLYSTVPNVKKPEALAEAVKTVWASVFNVEAWEARRWHGVPHDKVVMGVLVQRAIDSQSSGVLVTVNPFDPVQSAMTYVSAKRGLGIRVVEGRRQAEQVLYSRRSNSIQVLSRSDDPVALQLDGQGGVREEAVEPGRTVLTDAVVVQLARTGELVRQILHSGPQDIEWATDPQGRIVLLQSRPFVDRSSRM